MERVSPLRFPVNQFDSLADVLVPEFAKEDFVLENWLENVSEASTPEITEFIVKSFGKPKINIALDNILFYSNIRRGRNQIYAKLIFEIQNKLEIIINPICIGKKNGLLLREMFVLGYYTREQIKRACEDYTVIRKQNTYRPLYFYFAPELGLRPKDAHYYGIRDDYLDKLKEDDWYLWKEVTTYGYETHSIMYALANDDIVLFRQCMVHYGADDSLTFNSFEGTMRNETHRITHIAAFFGAVKCFKDQLANGCLWDADVCNWAAKGGNIEILQMCKNHDECDFKESFYHACECNHREAADFVLLNKAKVCDISCSAKTNFVLGNLFVLGYTDAINAEALHNAIINGNRTIARLLLLEESEVNFRTNSGRTVVHEAAELGFDEVLVLLKQRLADFTLPDTVGTVPLHLSIKSNNFDTFKIVLSESKSVIDAIDDFGSPLHYAARYGNEDTCSALVAAGANVNSVGAGGYTPLHIASKKNKDSIVRFLKEHGAEMEAKSTKGHVGKRLASSNFVKSLYN